MSKQLATLAAFAALFVSLVGNATTLYVAEKADAQLCEQLELNRGIILTGEQRRLKVSEQYLKDFPKGSEAIPLQVILDSIANSKLNIRDLVAADCP